MAKIPNFPRYAIASKPPAPPTPPATLGHFEHEHLMLKDQAWPTRPKAEKKKFSVSWIIEVEAENEVAAASKAREYLSDELEYATVSLKVTQIVEVSRRDGESEG